MSCALGLRLGECHPASEFRVFGTAGDHGRSISFQSVMKQAAGFVLCCFRDESTNLAARSVSLTNSGSESTQRCSCSEDSAVQKCRCQFGFSSHPIDPHRPEDLR